METVGLGFTWNDLEVGRKFKTVGRTVTEATLTYTPLRLHAGRD